MYHRLEAYLSNVRACRELSNRVFSGPLSQSELIASIQETVQLQSAYKQLNDEILNDPACGVCVPPEDLTPDQIVFLGEFASQLHDFMLQLDTGLCYHIHRKLLHRAQLDNDLDGQIRESYYCGLSLYYLSQSILRFHNVPLRRQVRRHFLFGATYLKRMEDFENLETRNYILRCFSNIRLGLDVCDNSDIPPGEFTYQEQQRGRLLRDIMLHTFSDPAFRAKAPTFTWDTALFVTQASIANSGSERMKDRRDGVSQVRKAWKSSRYVYQNALEAHQLRNRYISGQTLFHFKKNAFLLGLIPLEEVLSFLEERALRSPSHEYSTEAAFAHISCPLHFLDFYRHFGTPTPQNEARVRRLQGSVQDYVLHMPVQEDLYELISSLTVNLSLLHQQGDELDDHLLRILLSFHRPTYVHSLMVASLVQALLHEMLQRQPERVRALTSKGEAELLAHAYRFGIYHDVGKLNVIQQVRLYERKLLPIEFQLLQEHCVLGATTLGAFTAGAPYAQGALGHHRYYNNQGGYPASYQRTEDLTQLLVDLLTVADSLDAATDNIGRCYAKGIPLETLLGELRAQSGTRYAPFVVALFDNEVFCQHIAHMLREGRLRTYCQVYNDNSNLIHHEQ